MRHAVAAWIRARSRLRHGLGGAAFRPNCDWLVGVDISPGMIEQARAKGLYDRLEVSDLLEFLAAEVGASHHLVLAADVFV